MDGIQKPSEPTLVRFGGLFSPGSDTFHRFTCFKVRFCISSVERQLGGSSRCHGLSSAQLAVPTVWTEVFRPFRTTRFEFSDEELRKLPVVKIFWLGPARKSEISTCR